jgi:hypothetical protein
MLNPRRIAREKKTSLEVPTRYIGNHIVGTWIVSYKKYFFPKRGQTSFGIIIIPKEIICEC